MWWVINPTQIHPHYSHITQPHVLPEHGACLCFTKISFLFSETHSGPLRYNMPVLPFVPVPTAGPPYYPGQNSMPPVGHPSSTLTPPQVRLSLSLTPSRLPNLSPAVVRGSVESAAAQQPGSLAEALTLLALHHVCDRQGTAPVSFARLTFSWEDDNDSKSKLLHVCWLSLSLHYLIKDLLITTTVFHLILSSFLSLFLITHCFLQ